MRNVLVVGARNGGLGHVVAERLNEAGVSVTKGDVVTGSNMLFLDAESRFELDVFFGRHKFTDVVCTVGVNTHLHIGDMSDALLRHDLHVNAVAPMNVLASWLTHGQKRRMVGLTTEGPRHFAAISSNSARIPRSSSLGYCMSKAALSMGIQSAARYAAYQGWAATIYGYEFGWIDNTPMSEDVVKRLSPGAPGHRIPTGGLSKHHLADMIVRNLLEGGKELNGTLLRVDGGEQ